MCYYEDFNEVWRPIRPTTIALIHLSLLNYVDLGVAEEGIFGRVNP